MAERRVFYVLIGILVVSILSLRLFYFEVEPILLLIEFVVYLSFWFMIGYLTRKQNKILCDNCNKLNSNKNIICSVCGNNIEDIICPVCKGYNAYSNKYCVECQTKL